MIVNVRHFAMTMMKLIEIVRSRTQSVSAYRKVRLKCDRVKLLNHLVSSEIVVITLCLLSIISSVSCLETRNNRPPRFLIDNQHSEIVLRLKEGPDTPVGKIKPSSGFLNSQTTICFKSINRQLNLQAEGL